MKWKLDDTRAALAGLVLAMAFGLAATTVNAQGIMKCVDEKGVTHYGDPLPPQCAKKEIKQLSDQGLVKKTLERPLTPEEIKAKEEDAIKRKDEVRREAEQQRRDRALVATYGAEKEFDVSRDKALDVINARYKTAESRLKELDEQMKKLDGEMEFYQAGKSKSGKGKEAPQALTENVARTKRDKDVTAESLKRMDEEKKTIIAQFEADKQRWKDLKTGKANLKAEEKTYLPVKKAGERGTVICNNVEHTCRAGYLYACRGTDGSGNPSISMLTCK